jgi:hypothetical protein
MDKAGQSGPFWDKLAHGLAHGEQLFFACAALTAEEAQR